MPYVDYALDPDKSGSALKEQRFRMLEDIARELSGEVIFPTCFDAILHLREILQDPNLGMTQIATAISSEPLISAKLVHIANSVIFNPQGREVVDVKSAVIRLGLNTVRSTAMAIAMRQLMRAKTLAEFSGMAHLLWEHSVQSAAAARLIAARHTKLNADEAMLAGLIHDLGAFYMLYRASQYEELRHRPDTVRYLIIQWHESIGMALFSAIGIPQEIIDATIDHDVLRPAPKPVHTLRDVVYIANMLSGGHLEWLGEAPEDLPQERQALEAEYADLRPEIDSLTEQMLGHLGS